MVCRIYKQPVDRLNGMSDGGNLLFLFQHQYVQDTGLLVGIVLQLVAALLYQRELQLFTLDQLQEFFTLIGNQTRQIYHT